MTKTNLNRIIFNFEEGIAAVSKQDNISTAVKEKAANILKEISDIVKDYAEDMNVIAPSKINESVSGFTDSYLTSSNLYMDRGNGFVKLSVLVTDGKIKLSLNSSTSIGVVSEEAKATKSNVIKFAKAYVALCQ